MAKMLFASKPQDFQTLLPMKMKRYPFKGYKYLTWCGYCIMREDTSADMPEEDSNHENIHLRQAQDAGTWLKFYARYLWSWFRLSPLFRKFGYYLNKFETEAYAKEQDMTYLIRRPENNVALFDQPDKSEVWKSAGRSSYLYKKMIKEKFQDI